MQQKQISCHYITQRGPRYCLVDKRGSAARPGRTRWVSRGELEARGGGASLAPAQRGFSCPGASTADMTGPRPHQKQGPGARSVLFVKRRGPSAHKSRANPKGSLGQRSERRAGALAESLINPSGCNGTISGSEPFVLEQEPPHHHQRDEC
jgi:hypothetical protein